jgi:hypothetical protein
MSNDAKEVEQLFPQGKEVTLKGKAYQIKPFGFGQFPKVLKLFKDVKDVKIGGEGGVQFGDMTTFMLENADIVVEFAMLATKEKREFFDDVALDESVDLVQAIVEVNADFFVTRLQPKLLTAMSKLTESVGGLSSQSLSQTATA